MNARDAIKLTIDMGNMVGMKYLEDLTDDEMMRRPCPGCNHINWQVGHLIAAENSLLEKFSSAGRPALPAGFKERYSKETCTLDDPARFCTKAELMQAFKEQRDATLASLAKMNEGDFDQPTGMDFFPNVGTLYELQGSHWLMHAGQWAVVRRQLGRQPVI